MSHYLAGGDNGTSVGHAGVVLGLPETPRYTIPSKPCAFCGHVVRHDNPDKLRDMAKEHATDAHGIEFEAVAS